MRDRDWSRVRLFEEVGAALGYGPKSRSGFLPLLVDKEPTPSQAAILARHFGEPPTAAPEPTTATQTPDPLVAAIDRQTAMLKAVLEAIVNRLPPTEDPLVREALEGIAGAELEAAAERRRSTSLPRTPDPEHRSSGQRSRRRAGETSS